jgi:hypothetical protein
MTEHLGRRAGIEERLYAELIECAPSERTDESTCQVPSTVMRARQIEKSYALNSRGQNHSAGWEASEIVPGSGDSGWGLPRCPTTTTSLFLQDLLRQRLFREIDSAAIAEVRLGEACCRTRCVHSARERTHEARASFPGEIIRC